MKPFTRVFTSLTSILLLAALSACGDTQSAPDPAENVPDTSASVTESDTIGADYIYPELDCGGDTFTILNSDTSHWGFYSYMDFEEQSGEQLDDAVYERNRNLEERYHFELVIVTDNVDTNYNLYRTAIYAGEDAYDTAYIRCDRLSSFVLEDMLYDLTDYDTFRLSEDWWDQLVNEKARIGTGNAQYFAANDISLSGFDGTLCVYFNETMMGNLDIELPYNLVREGTWTIDRLTEMAKAGANLNGDNSFSWNENGNAVYGLASYEDCVNGFLTGAGESYISIQNGQPSLVSDNERFFGLFDKIYELTSADGVFLYQNGSGNNHYEMVFKNNRALFTVAEIKASSKYRDMEQTFGIVPIPKYDEAQEQYYSHRTHVCPTMSVPVTNDDPARTGIIIDAMAYESYRDILPIYYDVKVSQKGLRNEESIEMLGIIRAGRSFDIGEGYGWTEDLSAKINTMYVSSKKNNIASTLESSRSAIEAAIEKTMEYLNRS